MFLTMVNVFGGLSKKQPLKNAVSVVTSQKESWRNGKHKLSHTVAQVGELDSASVDGISCKFREVSFSVNMLRSPEVFFLVFSLQFGSRRIHMHWSSVQHFVPLVKNPVPEKVKEAAWTEVAMHDVCLMKYRKSYKNSPENVSGNIRLIPTVNFLAEIAGTLPHSRWRVFPRQDCGTH